MKKMIQEIRAEGMKMRRTFLYPIHMAVPLLCSLLFLLYYRFAGWNEGAQILAYMEVIGAALPFMASVVCGGNIELEERNQFQVLLGGSGRKGRRFLAKYLTLSGMGFLSIFAAVALFGAGFHFLLGKEGISAGKYMQLITVLFAGSVPLYLEHLFLNLAFQRTVSHCFGVAEFLLSALFLTGLGEGRWQFFPCTWSARGALLMFNLTIQEGREGIFSAELIRTGTVCPLLLFLLCAIIGIWFYFYEGRQCHD